MSSRRRENMDGAGVDGMAEFSGVDPLRAQVGHARVYRLISSRSASSDSNRSSSSPAARRSRPGAAEVLRRRAGRRQPSARWSAACAARGDIGGEPALQLAELLELADLTWMLPAIPLNDSASVATSIVAVHGHPFVQVPSANRSAMSAACRTGPDHLPGDQRGDPGQQQREHDPADEQRALDDRERALLAGRAGRSGRPRGRGPRSAPGCPTTSVGMVARPGRMVVYVRRAALTATCPRSSAGTSSTVPADSPRRAVGDPTRLPARSVTRPGTPPAERRARVVGQRALVSRSSALFSSPWAPSRRSRRRPARARARRRRASAWPRASTSLPCRIRPAICGLQDQAEHEDHGGRAAPAC